MPLSMTLEPVQKQQLTQHLIQQMNLLQMTSEELDAFVAREVEQNPLLDSLKSGKHGGKKDRNGAACT